MFAQIVWWATNALEGLLLARPIQGRFLKKYSFFYFYLTYVFLQSLACFYVYLARPSLYQPFYWYTQLFSVLLGYGVIWEIFRQALSRYPGASRMARNVLGLILVMVLSKVFVNALSGPIWSPAKTTAELERNLRTVQGILLVAVIALLVYYAIPIGRNLRGMLLGYGFFVATSIVSLTVRSYLGNESQWWWQYVQPVAYFFVLLIWCGTLWSFRPNPEPEAEAGIERDYMLLAGATKRRLLQARAYLTRAVRP